MGRAACLPCGIPKPLLGLLAILRPLSFNVRPFRRADYPEAILAKCVRRAVRASCRPRGGRLENPKKLSAVAARKGTAANRMAAKAHNERAKSTAVALRDTGYSLTAIAETLIGRSVLTRRGKRGRPRR